MHVCSRRCSIMSRRSSDDEQLIARHDGAEHGRAQRRRHFPDTDYAAIARACGCHAERVNKPGEVKEALEAALKQDKPAVIDAVIDPLQDMKKELYSPLAIEILSGAGAARVY